MTREELESALRSAHKAGNVEHARKLAAALSNFQEERQPPEPKSFSDYNMVTGKANPMSVRNLVTPVAEAGLALGSAGLAGAKGGYDAIWDWGKNELIAAAPGMADRMGVQIGDPKQRVVDAQMLAYQPRTERGRAITDTIAAPLAAYGRKGTEMADRAQAATGSKIYGAGTEAVWNLLPSLIGARTPKNPYAAARPNPVVEAVMNRLPGGTRSSAKTVLGESMGPRIHEVRDSLINARKDQTAGQATVPADSYETSALFKMVESEDPSYYGPLYRGQGEGRLARLQKEAGTPAAQEAMKSVRKSTADSMYNKGRKGVLPESDVASVVSKVDNLIENNPGFPELLTALRGVRKGLVDETGAIRTNARQVMSTVDGLRKLIETKDAGNLKGPLTELKRDVVKLSDDFVKADEFYAKASRPITQSEIFQELVDVLTPKLNSRERATQYVNAITGKGQKLTTKRATGKSKPPRAEFDEALEPYQRDIVKKIGEELENNALYTEQANLGTARMNKIAGTSWNSEKLRILDTKMVILNNIIKRLEGRSKGATTEYLAKLGKPENRAELIKLIEEMLPEEMAIMQEAYTGTGALAPGAVEGAKQREAAR